MALIERETDRLIGDMGFFRVEILGRMENDLGWILDRHAWGKGYATEAGKALIETGWDVYGMRRIVANMAFDHLASRGVAERLGMQLERTFANPRNRGIETCLYVIEKP